MKLHFRNIEHTYPMVSKIVHGYLLWSTHNIRRNEINHSLGKHNVENIYTQCQFCCERINWNNCSTFDKYYRSSSA